MKFSTELAAFTAAEISAALGCPLATAYDWLTGRRAPPAWQQPHWIKILKASRKTTGRSSARG